MLAAVSCGSETAGEDTTAPADTTTAETTEDNFVYDDLPEQDFGGAAFNMLTTSWYIAADSIYAESQNGDVLNDALYESRRSVEERFNVEIKLQVEADPTTTLLPGIIHNMVMAGDSTYHLIYNHDVSTVKNALQGDFKNIRGLPNINFDKPWWNGTSENFTIDGKLLFTGNCLATSSIFMNYLLAFNKTMAESYSIEIPYDDVIAGNWYMDDLIALTQDMRVDLDGNSKFNENDQYGISVYRYSVMGLQSDLGGDMAVNDGSGLVLNTDIEKLSTIVEKVRALTDFAYYDSNSKCAEAFANGNILFLLTEGSFLTNTVRQSNVVYGILPVPKLDENQENYRASGCDIYWAVPKTAENPEMIGTVIEAVCCQNYNNVIPQVWETVLGRKLADSEEDAAMFEIMRDIQYVDIGFAFSGESSGLDSLVFLAATARPGKVVSYIDSYKNNALSGIDKINAFYRDFE